MTKERQNIVIAEFCGWTDIKPEVRGSGAPERRPSPYGCPPGKKWKATIPNYTGSLDAMHEAIVGRLTPMQESEFQKNLFNIFAYAEGLRDSAQVLCNSTAAQRAEALIKTIGRWEEE